MPTTTEDLIAAALETADCEKSNNFSESEKLRCVNEALSSTYDLVVTAWKDYFSASVAFTLPSTNTIGLAEVTTGIPPVPAYPVAAPAAGARVLQVPYTPFQFSLASSLLIQYFKSGGSVSFATPQLAYVPPAGRVLQIRVTPTGNTSGTATTDFVIVKNGLPTLARLVMAPGATADVLVTANESTFLDYPNGSVPTPVHFNGQDTMEISAQEFGTASAWNMIADVLMQLDQPPSLMFKELGLTRTQDGIAETIEPLAGFPSRNDDGRRRYWISGQNLSLWPQVNGVSHAGTYVLDYVPNCPVLAATDILPNELERWKELISVKAAIKFLAKRKQSTVELEQKRVELEAAITVAASSRRSEVRKLRGLRTHDQFPWNRNDTIYPRR